METVSYPLMQQMARIGMDWNLKKFGPTFSSFNAAIAVSLMKFVWYLELLNNPLRKYKLTASLFFPGKIILFEK